ncbi:MAG: hypothetical protein IPG80_12435 [Anaerolineales bacterium]|uniref:Kelch repeat-containing protein n=1 Tax=Candidatus Villigracilis vicinus TaxID=3140679 RepID=UPI003135FC72|nr:hypothetical protein [Anaerolineales bacterium]
MVARRCNDRLWRVAWRVGASSRLVEGCCDRFRGCTHRRHCLTPIAVYLFGGITASGSSFITAYLLQTGQGIWSAVVSTNFLTEPVDKITTAMIAFAIIQGLPKRTIGGYPKADQVATEGGASSTQLYIAIGVVVALVLFAAFMLRNILGG